MIEIKRISTSYEEPEIELGKLAREYTILLNELKFVEGKMNAETRRLERKEQGKSY